MTTTLKRQGICSLLILFLVMGAMFLVSPENVFAKDGHGQRVRQRSNQGHHLNQPTRRGHHVRQRSHHGRHVRQHARQRHHVTRSTHRRHYRFRRTSHYPRTHHYYHHGGYFFIHAPIGFHIRILPYGHWTVLYRSHTYFYFNNTYYSKINDGYVVVENPVRGVTQTTYPVTFSNPNGSYTSVIIEKSGSGYIGPQEEYFHDFPSVAQLKSMYAFTRNP